MPARPESQTDLNYEAFLAKLPDLMREHAGSFALLHNGDVFEYFSNPLEATLAGAKRFGSGQYSVQEVTEQPEHLGFYSYVGGAGTY